MSSRGQRRQTRIWDSFDVLGVLGSGKWSKRDSIQGIATWKCGSAQGLQPPEYGQELLNEVATLECICLEDCFKVYAFQHSKVYAGGLFVIATDIVGRLLEDTDCSGDQELPVNRMASSWHHPR